MITQQILKKYVVYNPKTGLFAWKERKREEFKKEYHWLTWNKNNKGKVIKSAPGKKRIYFRIEGTMYPASNMAILYMTGRSPHRVGYLDDVVQNNRFNNLSYEFDTRPRKNISKVFFFEYQLRNEENWVLFKDGKLLKTGRLIDLMALRNTFYIREKQ